MVDLEKPNHLSPNHTHRMVWKLLFDNVSQLMDVRGQLFDLIKSNSKGGSTDGMGGKNNVTQDVMDIEALLSEQDTMHGGSGSLVIDSSKRTAANSWNNIQELREYDVPYVARVCMDLDIPVLLIQSCRILILRPRPILVYSLLISNVARRLSNFRMAMWMRFI